MPPLNGTKTHPLKPATIAVLRQLAEGPIRSHLINPGIRNRLEREGLAEEHSAGVFHFAKTRQWEITPVGRAALAEIDKSQ